MVQNRTNKDVFEYIYEIKAAKTAIQNILFSILPNARRISNTHFECKKNRARMLGAQQLNNFREKKINFPERMALGRRRSRPQCLSERGR